MFTALHKVEAVKHFRYFFLNNDFVDIFVQKTSQNHYFLKQNVPNLLIQYLIMQNYKSSYNTIRTFITKCRKFRQFLC